MIVIRLAGWVLVFFGLLLIGHDLFQVLASRGFHPENLGDLLNDVSRNSADLARTWVLSRLGEWASIALAAFFQIWAFLATGVPGILMTRVGLAKPPQITYTDSKAQIHGIRAGTKRR